MAFIQVIDVRSDEFDQLRKLDEEWEQATEGQRTARRHILARDRNQPDRYLSIVFFDSYESAMENSQLPATDEISQRMRALTRELSFVDLDVLEDREL